MATIKVHVYSNEDDGTESCDYRGKGELKGQHKTLLEKEFGPDVQTNEDIEAVIADGPEWNRLTKKLLEGARPGGVIGQLLGAVADGAGIRIGVFDH
jgi:hypothetical protein